VEYDTLNVLLAREKTTLLTSIDIPPLVLPVNSSLNELSPVSSIVLGLFGCGVVFV
jgi:hypothetical protein